MLMNREIRAAIFFIFAWLLWLMSSSLVTSVVMGGAISILVFPVYLQFLKWKLKPGLASASVVLLLSGVVLVPVSFLFYYGITTGVERLEAWQSSPFTDASSTSNWFSHLIEGSWIGRALESIGASFNFSTADLYAKLNQIFLSMGKSGLALATQFVTSLPQLTIQFFVMLISLYFFLLDGRKLGNTIKSFHFLNSQEFQLLNQKFKNLCKAVLLASLASGLVQALIYSLGVLMTKADSALLMLVLVFIVSFIPILGAAPLTFGFALYELMSEESLWRGVVLLVFAGLTSLSDNFVRPFVLKDGANLHPLIAFLSMLGGLQAFGFSGIFLGPILVGLFLVIVEILLVEKK
jgi:predicted PurR-regulated permease PerM